VSIGDTLCHANSGSGNISVEAGETSVRVYGSLNNLEVRICLMLNGLGIKIVAVSSVRTCQQCKADHCYYKLVAVHFLYSPQPKTLNHLAKPGCGNRASLGEMENQFQVFLVVICQGLRGLTIHKGRVKTIDSGLVLCKSL